MAIITKMVRTNNNYNNVKFDDIDFGSLGYVVQTSPNYEFAESEVEGVRVPGRNGEAIRFTGAYLNTTRSYTFIKNLSDNEDFRDHVEFYNAAQALVSKIKTKNGYKVLQDSYESEVYREAYYKDANVVSNGLNQVMTIQIDFVCKPQRFLIDGLTEITSFIDPVNNPTEFASNPEIKISKGSSASIKTTILKFDEENVLTINWEGATNIIIDSDIMDCYDSTGANLNEKVNYISDFPKLKSGETIISLVDKNSSGEVVSENKSTIDYLIPRWWRL